MPKPIAPGPLLEDLQYVDTRAAYSARMTHIGDLGQDIQQLNVPIEYIPLPKAERYRASVISHASFSHKGPESSVLTNFVLIDVGDKKISCAVIQASGMMPMFIVEPMLQDNSNFIDGHWSFDDIIAWKRRLEKTIRFSYTSIASPGLVEPTAPSEEITHTLFDAIQPHIPHGEWCLTLHHASAYHHGVCASLSPLNRVLTENILTEDASERLRSIVPPASILTRTGTISLCEEDGLSFVAERFDIRPHMSVVSHPSPSFQKDPMDTLRRIQEISEGGPLFDLEKVAHIVASN